MSREYFVFPWHLQGDPLIHSFLPLNVHHFKGKNDSNSLNNIRISIFFTQQGGKTLFQLHFYRGELWGILSQNMTDLIF